MKKLITINEISLDAITCIMLFFSSLFAIIVMIILWGLMLTIIGHYSSLNKEVKIGKDREE